MFANDKSHFYKEQYCVLNPNQLLFLKFLTLTFRALGRNHIVKMFLLAVDQFSQLQGDIASVPDVFPFHQLWYRLMSFRDLSKKCALKTLSKNDFCDTNL